MFDGRARLQQNLQAHAALAAEVRLLFDSKLPSGAEAQIICAYRSTAKAVPFLRESSPTSTAFASSLMSEAGPLLSSLHLCP